jgi:cytoskeleton protein RodZ
MAETQAEGAQNPGADLRAERERRGLSVHQVAQELHVSDFMIDALERGDYPVLGEPVFVRGHLRNYARALGISEQQLLSAYEQTQNKPPPPPLVTQRSVGMNPKTREWMLRAASAGVLAVLVGLAIAWWMHRPEDAPATLTVTRTTPAPLPAAVTTTTVATVADLANASPASPPPAAKPAAKAPVEPPASHAPRVSKPLLTPNPVQPPVAQTVPAADGSATQARFTLNSASWIEVYDSTGKRLYYDLAPAGQTLDVSGSGPLQIFLGNAPGVSVQVDGAEFNLAPYIRVDNTARFRLGDKRAASGN